MLYTAYEAITIESLKGIIDCDRYAILIGDDEQT